MAPFTARRVERSAAIRLLAPPAAVFPLFEPLGERNWVPGWDPAIVYPASGQAERGAVFLTGDAAAPAVWTLIEFAPQDWRVAYVRVSPASHVALITVRCADLGDGTTGAEVSYAFTGLSAAGNEYVEQFTPEHYAEWIGGWETAINHYLRHGVAAHAA